MSNYIPHYRKKMQHLRKREQELRRLIARGASQDKLLEAALEVRDGRIRVLRARQNQTHPTLERESFHQDQVAIEALQALPAEAVLAEYRSGG